MKCSVKGISSPKIYYDVINPINCRLILQVLIHYEALPHHRGTTHAIAI